MAKKMLIDATQSHGVRVAVAANGCLEHFLFESSDRKPLKNNIYLAKIARIEPSLQAAFADYGGNRHGFLPFGEINDDYYQLPISDRKNPFPEEGATKTEDKVEGSENGTEESESTSDDTKSNGRNFNRSRNRSDNRYKIQEVINRNQVMLVQLLKEERYNKGAVITTRLALAGRYCVLMPMTASGGGVSRKIVNIFQRKKLRKALDELKVEKGMSVIIRTAGEGRTKTEIKKDYEYLLKLWKDIRELTKSSNAPCLIHEEGSLVKTSIRDLYNREIEHIDVSSDEEYKMAKDTMKAMIPSHARKVRRFKHKIQSIFEFNKIGGEISKIYKPNVELKSGGYIVINQTEALVAVDVNSGRSIKERNIEETALKTNLEAAEETAKQIRLRNLSGLIVIDFIDMEIKRNQIKVERFLKDQLKNDRARNQIGQISSFGLLEMSRQRIGTSITEMQGSEVSALEVLRKIENECIREKNEKLFVYTCPSMLPYLVNEKRGSVLDLENKYDTKIYFYEDNSLPAPNFRISTNILQNWRMDGQIIYDSTAERGRYQNKSFSKRKHPKTRRRIGEESNERLEQSVDSEESSKKNNNFNENAKYRTQRSRRKFPFKRSPLNNDKKEETRNIKPDDATKTKVQPSQDQEMKEKIGKKGTNFLLRTVKKASNKKESVSESKKAKKPKKKRGGWWQQK